MAAALAFAGTVSAGSYWQLQKQPSRRSLVRPCTLGTSRELHRQAEPVLGRHHCRKNPTVGRKGMDMETLRGDPAGDTMISIVIFGASGNLARKKLFPALFALFNKGDLPEHFTIFGYARTEMTDEELRAAILPTLTCRIDTRENCEKKIAEFLQRCFYHSGNYSSEKHIADLDTRLKQHEENTRVANRLFYLSVPPNVFLDVARCTSSAAAASKGWTSVIVEKPFGRDSESCSDLTMALQKHFSEEQIYRIDHYLGKEAVKTLLALRSRYPELESLWSRESISDVQLILSEDFGTQGRGGYFDHYGIIRDVMQNHMLQLLAVVAMETPSSLNPEEIRDEKVKVLRLVKKIRLEDVVLGQYARRVNGGVIYPGYTDDETVPPGSTTPTFAAIALFIDNPRWDGVPFIMKAGKALNERWAGIRIRFKKDMAEIVVRIQPDAGIFLKVGQLLNIRLDPFVNSKCSEADDAYESLLPDAIGGDRSHFIRSDELDAAWEIFTPLLDDIQRNGVVPEVYPYGSQGPRSAEQLVSMHNASWGNEAIAPKLTFVPA